MPSPDCGSGRLRLAAAADREIIEWSIKEFGERAAMRYRLLITQALNDIAADPERLGSKELPEIMISGARVYHLSFSRGKSAAAAVKQPRHFLLYRRRSGGVIEAGRILHERRDLERNLPDEYRVQ